MRKLTLLAALLLLAPAISQAASLEDVLAEKGVITKGEAKGSGKDSGTVYWSDGTNIDYGSLGFTTVIKTYTRVGYTYTDQDEDAGNNDSTSSFDVHNARIYVTGSAMHDEFAYKLEADMVAGSASDGTKSPALLDSYIRWNACDQAALTMGQWKPAISRQYGTTEAKLQFANRSGVSDYFDLGRQQGLMASGDLMDGQISLGAAIFNGSSDGEGINSSGLDTKHTAVINARANLMGEMNAFEEGDVGWTDEAAVNLGAAASFGRTGDVVGDVDTDTINVDINAKYQGWSFHGEYYWMTMDSDASDDEPEPTGFYAQVGYFVLPKELELAVRYGFIDCDGNTGGVCELGDDVNQVAVSVNHFWWGHHLKGALGYEVTSQDPGDGGDDINTAEWTLRLSLYA